MLSSEEILLILSRIHPGSGYSDDPKIMKIQAKLSIMLEASQQEEAAYHGARPGEEVG